MKKIYQIFQKTRLLPHQLNRYSLAIMLGVLIGSMPPTLYAADHRTAITVTGKITDQAGAPLPGVNVLEKGTTNGTVTDTQGSYSITVTSGESVLVFSFIGTTTQEVVVGTQIEISVQLLDDTETLSEVVVIGYGTQEKKDITGAVASVKSEEFNKGIMNSPEQLLQGKVAGVNVTSASGEPGSPQAITIRGAGSVRSGSTPLFVVDGLDLDNSGTGGVTNPLNFLNPQDIETIDVLKDASATAIYGARGANGVVLITTKKGKAGHPTVAFSSNFGVSNLTNKIPVLGADEFRTKVVEIGGELTDLGGSTDWQKIITRTAYTQNYNLTFGGGSEGLTYYASLGLQDQEGILKNNDLKRYTGRINVSQKLLKDRLNLDLNLNATTTVSDRPNIEAIIGNALSL